MPIPKSSGRIFKRHHHPGPGPAEACLQSGPATQPAAFRSSLIHLFQSTLQAVGAAGVGGDHDSPIPCPQTPTRAGAVRQAESWADGAPCVSAARRIFVRAVNVRPARADLQVGVTNSLL
jgi:hypothetical protein